MNEEWNAFEELLTIEDELLNECMNLHVKKAPDFLLMENGKALDDVRSGLSSIGKKLLQEEGEENFLESLKIRFAHPGPLSGWDANQILREVKEALSRT